MQFNSPYIIKCDGGYHGHGDSLLVSAGSGVATLAIPGCPGIPEGIASNTLVVPFNDIESVKKVFETHKNKIAAMIVVIAISHVLLSAIITALVMPIIALKKTAAIYIGTK